MKSVMSRKQSQPLLLASRSRDVETSQPRKSFKIRKQTNTGNINLFRLKTRKKLSHSDVKNSAIMDMEIWVTFIQSLYFKQYVAKNYIGEINSNIMIYQASSISRYSVSK